MSIAASRRMATFIVDPGHGGTQLACNSTPVGVTGPTGLREKDVALLFAQKLLPKLGGRAIPTRANDRNLTLSQRAAIAQRAGADVFLSVHANGAAAGARGSEVWIHDRASPASTAMAHSVAAQLRRLGGRTRVRRGPLAILSPAHHAAKTAGCLLELDNLADAAGERRLRDPAALEALAAAVAAGVRDLGRYGRTVALEDAWPTRLRNLIPGDSGTTGQLDYAVDVREAINAVFGLEAWDDVVSAGEKELEEKLHDILEKIDHIPGAEELKATMIAAGLLFLAELAPIGAGYLGARENVAKEWARTGFAVGVVWAADDRAARELGTEAYESLWTPYSLPHPGGSPGPSGVDFDPAQERIARNCHRMGVIAGIASGKELSTTQKSNLFFDLQARDTGHFVDWDTLETAPENRPLETYWRASTVFRRNHVDTLET